jgi:hypothetical protein
MNDCTAERHGTRTAYCDYGCRCPEALAACAEAQANWTKRRYLNRGPLLIATTGTVRRIQALQAIGWPLQVLAERLGYKHYRTLQMISRQPTVHVDTAAKIARLFSELCMTPGPSVKARTAAAWHGHAPPLAWDDIDDPREVPKFGRPHDVKSVRAERLDEVRRLHALGLTYVAIAERLGTSDRQVFRDLSDMGLTRREAS